MVPVRFVYSQKEQDDDFYTAAYSVNLEESDLRLIRASRGSLFPVWIRDSRQVVIWDLDDVHSVLKAYNADGTGGRTLRITRTPFIEVK